MVLNKVNIVGFFFPLVPGCALSISSCSELIRLNCVYQGKSDFKLSIIDYFLKSIFNSVLVFLRKEKKEPGGFTVMP